MSHTTNAAGGTTFTHNGDYSGNVRILAPGGGWDAEIPFADLRELVFGYLRARIAERVEEASDDALEAMLTGGTAIQP